MKILIFIFCMSFSFFESVGQTILSSGENADIISGFQKLTDYHERWNSQFQFTLQDQRLLFPKPSTFIHLNTLNKVQGMFCKMEYRIETKSKLAPRFRLGSLNYTDWMEGKRELYERY